jgi:hypothetical protein
MKFQLSRLEDQLQALIEGSIARIFPGKDIERELAHQLVGTLHNGIQQSEDGEWIVPDIFVLQVHPSQVHILSSDQSLLDNLINSLQEAVLDAGWKFSRPPFLRVAASHQISPGDIQVVAWNSQQGLPETSALEASSIDLEPGVPRDAYLIVDGLRKFQLQQAVVNIGRNEDNHLVIDDKRISRQHAQLRAMDGRYVIFDLESTGGTWVNTARVQQQVLYPGDIISLAGLPLVYRQEGVNLDFPLTAGDDG